METSRILRMSDAATKRLSSVSSSSSSSSMMESSSLPCRPGKCLPVSIVSARDMIDELREINDAIFKGVRYSNEYYEDITSAGSFSKVAYVGHELAGAICCYVVTKGKEAYKRKEVNISTIGVLAQYRRKGVGTKLMGEVIDDSIADPFVTKLLLNVHINDTSAMSFYKRLGFEIINQVQLHQGAAWVMEKTLRTIGQERVWQTR